VSRAAAQAARAARKAEARAQHLDLCYANDFRDSRQDTFLARCEGCGLVQTQACPHPSQREFGPGGVTPCVVCGSRTATYAGEAA
jgi:hypothetical protein